MQKQGNWGGKVVLPVLECGRLLDCPSHDTQLHRTRQDGEQMSFEWMMRNLKLQLPVLLVLFLSPQLAEKEERRERSRRTSC